MYILFQTSPHTDFIDPVMIMIYPQKTYLDKLLMDAAIVFAESIIL
jgi:hypothetical protein